MALLEHAKTELRIAGLLDGSGDFYDGNTAKAVIELIDVFAKQGHSGMSASVVIDLFSKLARYEPITALTGSESEWIHVSEGLWQNIRNSAVFKDLNGCRYIDGIIKRTPDGACWSGSFYENKEAFEARDEKRKIYSRDCVIKSFPFVPKRFYIDVEEVEVAKDDWEMYAIDDKQLAEARKYYKI